MSSVYKATQEPIGRTVALKVLNHEFAKDPVNIKRFIREAKTVGALRHRNILSIHDLGNTEEGLPFFVMEFLEGISLESLIDKTGAVAIPRALSMFCQICDGMSYAHSKGLIHRDLKPANIMLVRDEDGSELVKLVDFGIVKQTQPQSMTQKLTKVGEIWGSPVYMSPEQCMGSELDGRSDIYSFGLLMYEVLAGLPAFKGGGAIGAIISRQLSQMPATFSAVVPRLMIPDSLERIIFKAIQKKPADRYASMDELRQALNDFGKKHGLKLPESTVTRNGGNAFEQDPFEVFKNSAVQQKPRSSNPASSNPATAGQDTTIQANYSTGKDSTARVDLSSPSAGQEATRRADLGSSAAGQDATQAAAPAKPTPPQRSDFGTRSSAQDAMRRADFGVGAGVQNRTVRADSRPGAKDRSFGADGSRANGSQDATIRADIGAAAAAQDETVRENSGSGSGAQDSTVRAKFAERAESQSATTRATPDANQFSPGAHKIPAGTYAPHTDVGRHPDDKRNQRLTLIIAGLAIVIALVSIASLANVFLSNHNSTNNGSPDTQSNITPEPKDSTPAPDNQSSTKTKLNVNIHRPESQVNSVKSGQAHKQRSVQKRSAVSGTASDTDEAFLEHVYLKKRPGDAVQQMLDIKQREQSSGE